MRLSDLQKFILLEALNSGRKKISRYTLDKFYDKQKKKPHKELMTKIITQSIERLINKELLIGYGIRTAYKWFIREISLTGKGKFEARKLLGEQKSLPFKLKKY